MHGDDVPRVGRVNLDFMSQACDVRIDRTRIKRGVFAPDVMQELLAGDSFVSVCDQELENFKFPGSEVDTPGGAQRLRDSGPQYDLFGHSAGAQFVHRFLLFKPNAKVRYALAANAGWYTVPDQNLPFSYGVKHPLLPITKRDIVEWTNKKLIILRGTADVNADHNLRVTPEANVQGKNRFERAAYMLEKGRAANPATKWQLVEVPGADHDQKKITPIAQELLRRYNETLGN